MMTSHSTIHRFLKRILPLAIALAAAVTCLVSAPSEAHAENLIKRPGAHNHYKFELEPHLGFFWGWGSRANADYGNGADFGPGIRASIPFMHNGPIDTINNNIGISFGLDTYFPNGDLVIISSPVAFQWNFYFTDVISVLGEAGLVMNIATQGRNNLDFDPLFQGGGRFQWGKIGVLVRIGYPSVSVGCNIQF